MNLIEQIKVNDTSIDGYQGTYYSDISEYVKVITDYEGNILEAINPDGSKYIPGDLIVDGSIYNEAFDQIVDSAIQEIEDIIDNAADTLTYFESTNNPEWLDVKLDSSNNILEGIRKDGTKYIALLDNPTPTPTPTPTYDDTMVLNVLNSDKIGIIGDSYTESAYCVKGKSYIQKLSLFSDYLFSNFGSSGDIYAGRIHAIRNKTPMYGNIPYSDQKVKYTMMCCYTNDIKYLTISEFLDSLRAAIKVVLGIGSIPIICTEYHTSSNPQATRCGLSNVAREFGLRFWNIAQITDLIYNKNGRFAPFWGSSHPGTRSNAIESDSYEVFLKGLPTPQQSVKVFRARKDTYENLDEYIFGNNQERAKLFTELSVGEARLKNASDVDNCSSAPTTLENSEYQLLMEKRAVSLKKVNLISAVLPCIGKDLSMLKFYIAHNSASLRLYIKNCLAQPYPTPTYYSSFYITFQNEPQVGDIYMCTEEDNRQYTVQGHVVDQAGKYHLFCTPFRSTYETVGTLVKLSGAGDDTLNYTFRERGINASSVTADDGYNYEKVEIDNDGLYDLTSKISGSVCVDKVDLLLVSDSNFNMTDFEFRFKASQRKLKSLEKEIEFKSNYWNENEELLPANHFGDVGVLDTNYNLTPSATYEETQGVNVYPLGCNSKVDITDSDFINVTIPRTKIKSAQNKLVLELWCRYFPAMYSDGSGNQITETSYDYNDIIVDIASQKSLKERVNTHWKVVRFDIPSEPQTALSLKIYSNSDGIELAYLSLKYND